MQVHENILKIADRFDALLLDAYGVLWSGREFFPNVPETMEALRAQGKFLCIVSNTTQIAENARESYERKGLQIGIHYDAILTSGEVAHRFLLKQSLRFDGCQNPSKFFVFGTPNRRLFEGTNYGMVADPAAADFIYTSIPQLDEDEMKNVDPQYLSAIHESALNSEDHRRFYDSERIEVFSQKLEFLKNLGKPILNVNPDQTACEKDRRTGENNLVIRQGSIAKACRNNGLEVVEFGKPHAAIFEEAMAILNGPGISDRRRIAMVGDTLQTDILGAKNAGLQSVLCLKTGVTAAKIVRPQSGEIDLERLKKEEEVEGVAADFLMERF